MMWMGNVIAGWLVLGMKMSDTDKKLVLMKEKCRLLYIK
jgi:hypothetical protein